MSSFLPSPFCAIYCTLSYNEVHAGPIAEVFAIAEKLRPRLRDGLLLDATGEAYDWLEIWDDEDDNGESDIIITGGSE